MEHAADSGGTGRRRPVDEVDDLVAAWQAERPDLDVRPMQVLSRISRLARHLDRERRNAFTAHGLESWEFDVLAALRRQGPPYELSPGALLRATRAGGRRTRSTTWWLPGRPSAPTWTCSRCRC